MGIHCGVHACFTAKHQPSLSQEGRLQFYKFVVCLSGLKIGGCFCFLLSFSCVLFSLALEMFIITAAAMTGNSLFTNFSCEDLSPGTIEQMDRMLCPLGLVGVADVCCDLFPVITGC